LLLQPFAPHLAEELWSRMVSPEEQTTASTLAYQPWPKFDAALLVETTIEIPVQVNGRLRDILKMPAGCSAAELEGAARESEKVRPFIEGKTIRKVIVVPNKLINIVAA
jgi:leucyl-tRNA synthetase